MPPVAAEGAVRAWLNDYSGIVGEGKPLPLGGHFKRLRSPAKGAYALLSRVGGSYELVAENPPTQARISAQFYATTKEAAERAANAYVGALLPLLRGEPADMGPTARCLAVDGLTGPLFIDDQDTNREQFRYLVDADFVLTAA